ncbi:MAG: hypothetical protein IJ157_13635 [Clostridia bacterium]|nr:hypothetical protein [Clostridia bacterium]
MRKFLSWLLIAALAISMCALASAETAAADKIDFADGAFGFLGLSTAKGNADAATELSVVDYNGGKALKIVSKGKAPYVAFNIEGLLGDKLANVRAVSATFGIDEAGPDGKFYAASGVVYTYTGEDNAEVKHDWSVYLAKKNPRTIVTKFGEDEVFVPGMNNILVISKETDNCQTATGEPVAMYLTDIQFLDVEGAALPVDLTAEYKAAETGRDNSNLFALSNPVAFEGFETTGGAWGQNGFDWDPAVLEALEPGSVLEIEYESEDGSMWVVFPDAAAGWSRIAQGEAYINGSKNIAQITYDQIVAVVGEDKTAWGGRLQCEAQTDWTVYSVKVGACGHYVTLANAVEFPGFETTGSAWGQDGFDWDPAVLEALVPGSAIEVTFESADDTMWVVFPDAAAGWSRIAQGAAAIQDGKAYITYDQIVAVVGEDQSAWGGRLQCEAQTDWAVYSVRVGQLEELPAVNKTVEFPGFETTGGAWGQNGFDWDASVLEALVPGSVLIVNFESEDNTMWVVFPDAAAGWSRIAQGAAVINGGKAYITYDQIVSVVGEDQSAWGGRLQCEAQTDWTVYGVAVGQAK